LRDSSCSSTVVDEDDLSSSFPDVGEFDVEIASSSLNDDDSSRKVGSVGGKSGTGIVLGSRICRGEVDDVVAGIVERGWRLVRNRRSTQNVGIVNREVGDITASSSSHYQQRYAEEQSD